MTGEKGSYRLMDSILGRVRRGEQMEVILTDQGSALTRFANNQVTQNVAQSALDISVRVQAGKRVGRASSNRTDRLSLNRLVSRAREGLLDRGKGERGMPMVARQRYSTLPVKRGPLNLRDPEGRGRAVKDIIAIARKSRAQTAGIVSFEDGLLGLANSRGVRCAHRITSGRVSITMTAGGGSGWSDRSGPALSAVTIRALAQQAATKCLKSRRPRVLAPGSYTVVLEPACVGDLLQFMAWYGFGAQAYQEEQSFLAGRMGKRLFSRKLTIEDNVFHSQALGFPFDFEGVPRHRVRLIEQGVARGLVHDRRTARRARTHSTGHGLPEPNDLGPIPLNLVMQGGDSSLKEMVSSTRRGILVTHFHYTNVMDPKRLILTGLTRDGVFLIEGGRIRHPVQNFRFTESLLKAFANVEAVGRDQIYSEGFFGGGFVVPALKIKNFQFTSLAEAEQPS